MEGMPELCRLSAVELVRLLKRGDVSPLELVEASAARIAQVDPLLNALPTLCIDRARDHARRILREGRECERPAAWLGGLPIAVKDLNPVAGVRTTYGSRIYADHVPKTSDRLVQRLEANGAIIMGKSNTPEFGAGANTFNEVFGQTRNPWNVTKSVAGSSGGSAAAIASGQVWLATGSDLGGSLRTPASFNAVVGLRPSPGRVVRGSPRLAFDMLNVEGPIARSAADAALFLDAMAGPTHADPLSLDARSLPFVDAVRKVPAPRRVCFSPNLGITPVHPEVEQICAAAAQRFADMGADLDDACPSFAGAFDTFTVLRSVWFAGEHEEHLRHHKALLKPEVISEIEKGLALTAADVVRAERERTGLYRNIAAFFEDHDLLLCPTAIVPPFDIDRRYVEEVNGYRFDNYVQWTSITSAITLTSCPAVSVPVGFTQACLPVGLQIIGPPRGESQVLAAAARLEEAVQVVGRLPVDPINP